MAVKVFELFRKTSPGGFAGALGIRIFNDPEGICKKNPSEESKGTFIWMG
jgi:hypothetical protein